MSGENSQGCEPGATPDRAMMGERGGALGPVPELSVVVLNWNAAEFLRACLDSLRAEIARSSATIEVIVVDNDSRLDDSRRLVREEFAEFALVENATNLGFGAGNNVGWRAARGRTVLFLNPDTVVEPGALDAMLSWMRAHPEIGALGPRMTYPDGELQFSARSFPSFGAGLFRNSFLGRLWPGNPWSRAYLNADLARDEPHRVDWLSGSALLARREALLGIDTGPGPWDEDFFMYCEDVDLCFRLGQSGWSRVYLPGATVQHHIGKSSDLARGTSIRRHHGAMWLFYRKHYMKGAGRLMAPLALFGIGARATLSVFNLYRGYLKSGVAPQFVRRKLGHQPALLALLERFDRWRRSK